ncbi:MAG: DUF1631 family protein [Rubrivivax sp.]
MTSPRALESLAEQVRQVFARQLEESLPALAEKVLEGARDQVMKPATYALGQQRSEAVRVLSAGLPGWLEQLRDHLRHTLDFGAATRFARALPTPEKRKPDRPADEDGSGPDMTLVDDSTIEYEILSSRLALAVMDRVSWEFSDLRSRVLMLERRAELDERDLLLVHVVARVAVEAWKSCGFSVEFWRDLQPTLHEEFTVLMEEAYHEANRWLIDQGVMPEIDLRPLIRRTRSGPAGASAGAATAPAGDDEPGHRRALGASGPPSGGVNDRDTAGPASTPTPAAPMVTPDQRAQAVLDRLSGLVAGTGVGAEDSGEFKATVRQPMVSPGLSQAMSAVQGAWVGRPSGQAQASALYTAPLLMQEIELQRLDLKRAAATQEERTTIEIVALLFQSILTDDSLPPAMRVWFARLQMPVLRVAVTEPDFFAALDHPARRLIDRMGACVMGFGSEGSAGDDVLGQEVKRIVQVVEAYPDTGRRVFQTVLNEFEKFLETYFRDHHENSRRGVSLAQQLEQRETLAIQYTIELRRMLEEVPVQEGVRQFLFDVWANVLATVAVGQGASGDQARAMKRVATDLIWSAGAKVTREERANVLRRLPALLKSLREGMSAVGISATRQEELIKQLNDSLAAGFTAKAAPIPQRQLHDLMEQLESLEEMMPDSAEITLSQELIRDIPGSFGAELEVVTQGGQDPLPAMLAWARELQVGTWYVLQQDDDTGQALQLVWHGLRKELSLFVSAEGRCKLFQQRRLAAYLQAGLLQPAQDEALTVRATRAALEQLNAHPERLLS